MRAAPVPLEPDAATLRAWLDACGALALDAARGDAAAPACGALGGAALDIADEVSRPIAEEPLAGGVDEALRLVRRAAEAGLVPGGPGYLAYVPGSGLFASALADLVAANLNRFTGLTAASPALCRLEGDVLAWLAAECGYGSDARGVLLSGGSLANLGGVLTAREARFGDAGDLRRATAYTSAQAHHCVDKALRLAGLRTANVRRVPVDAAFRLDADALRRAVAADRGAGLEPFLVVASAGTTNTGAVDPLPDVAAIAREHGLWLHVDAAYGGAFVLCDEGRRRLAGLAEADSLALDPHKGLFLPFGTGCLLVRDGRALRAAHSAHAGYLQDFDALERGREAPSPTEYGPELSRSYRGLRLWLPLMLHGARAFRAALAEKLALAARFHDGLCRRIDAGAALEVVAEPQLSTTAFRPARRAGESLDAWNTRGRALLAAVNARGRVHLSSTALPVADGDAFTLRVCVLGMRTHAEQVDACLADLDAALGSA